MWSTWWEIVGTIRLDRDGIPIGESPSSWPTIANAYSKPVLHTHDARFAREITSSKHRPLGHHVRLFVSTNLSKVSWGRVRRAAVVSGVLAASLCAQACIFETSDARPPAAAGRLIMRWTVDESTDPSHCSMGGADDFDIVITRSTGEQFGEYKAPCTDFETTISDLILNATFFGDATLVTATNEQRTTTIHVDPFVIHSADLVIDVDFPASSFF